MLDPFRRLRPIGPVLAALIVFSGCVRRDLRGPTAEELRDLDYASVPSEPVAGELVYRDSTLMGAWDIWRLGDDLLVAPGREDSVVAVVAIEGFHRRGFLARVGDGPLEYRQVGSITWAVDGGAILIHDPSTRRLRQRPPGLLVGGRGEELARSPSATAYQLLALSESTFVTLSMLDSHRFVVRDGEGRILEQTGPVPGPPEFSNLIRNHAYQSTIVTNSTRSRIAFLQRHGGGIEIFDRSARTWEEAETPFAFTPRITVAQAGAGTVFVGGPGLRFGYVGGTATDSLILALFSGHTRGGGTPAPTSGSYLHVFDWSGRLLRVFALDRPASAVAVSSDGRTLYASIDDSIPGIARYALPPVRAAARPSP